MRKFIFLILLCGFTMLASAQLTSTTGKLIPKSLINDSIQVFIFNGITSSSDITYNGFGKTINWYKYSNPATSIANISYISPEADTGYILDVDGKKTYIWVIDYQNFLPVLNSIEPDPTTVSPCENLNLSINANVPRLSYKSPNNADHFINRNFEVKYQSVSWDGTKWSLPTDTTVTVILPVPQISVPAPLCNTYFTLVGDEYAQLLGMTITPAKSSQLYSAVAVQCHPTTVVSPRTQTNEGDRPTQASPISFSAPIEVQFLSNPNPAATSYSWEIFKDGNKTPIVSRIDQDQRYIFVDYGVYNVKVTVASANCSYSDSITVNVSLSALEVPYVFTPNGDGSNDEFRVAYRSLASFQCWVYNRWGRQVFYWTDPQKGWDGKINGKNAAEGPYFYVIKAYGTDYNKNSKPDPKTGVRLGEYQLKGSINLLRGNIK
jgi:gliding motility-associated-like protein